MKERLVKRHGDMEIAMAAWMPSLIFFLTLR
jgi:hypothetical protein